MASEVARYALASEVRSPAAGVRPRTRAPLRIICAVLAASLLAATGFIVAMTFVGPAAGLVRTCSETCGPGPALSPPVRVHSQRVTHLANRTLAVATVAAVAPAAEASARRPPARQTIVLDASFRQTVVDRPPRGPSVGDIEHDDGQVHDAAGHLLGTLHVTCVLTRLLANGDALERCAGTATTTDGKVRLRGVGHLNPPNPPWQVTGLSGRYAGLHGRLSYQMNIPLGETPLGLIPAGPFDSVGVVKFPAARGLRAGVVPRPAANARFISRANSLCEATQTAANKLPPFPFSNFDPLHPDPTLLPQVGHFFDQPDRRRLFSDLLSRLVSLGTPPAQPAEWATVLQARRAQIANETAQIHAALADHMGAFVRAVTESGPAYNKLVLASAVFGVQACTFG